MLRALRADLHIHTCLSPCGDLEMSPRKIAEQARSRALNMIGICDHNSAENVLATKQAAARFGITVIPGMEVTSREEVHILALFDSAPAALSLQRTVYDHLPGENDEEVFGLQVVANHKDEVLAINKRLLIGATSLSLERIIDLVHADGGLAIASHIDREGFSLVGQLGFIPDDLELDALELSPLTPYEKGAARFGGRFPLIVSSDAHFLKDIGAAATSFLIEEGTVAEIRKALLGTEGRKLLH